MTKLEQDLLALVYEHDGSLGNGKARELLGWDEATYNQVKETLVAKGQVVQGRGRGGSISLVAGIAFAKPSAEQGGQEAVKPSGLMADKPESLKASEPDASSREADRPLSQEAPKPSASAKASADTTPGWAVPSASASAG